jgi:glycolate oxidase iron-sulfur subunit
MKEADRCCSSAGIYNLIRSEMANALLGIKMEHAVATEAFYLLTSNPGMSAADEAGVDRHNAIDRMKVMHVVDFFCERMERMD